MYNDKQNKRAQRYIKENYEQLSIRLKKGSRDRYKALAERLGLSVNQLFIQAVEQYISDNIDKLSD